MPVVCVLVRDFDLLNIIFMNNRKETRITCGLLDLPGLSQLRDQLSHIFLQNNHTGRTGELFKRGDTLCSEKFVLPAFRTLDFYVQSTSLSSNFDEFPVKIKWRPQKKQKINHFFRTDIKSMRWFIFCSQKKFPYREISQKLLINASFYKFCSSVGGLSRRRRFVHLRWSLTRSKLYYYS